MAGSSSAPAPVLEQAIERYRTLLHELEQRGNQNTHESCREIVLLRDRIHVLLRESRNLEPAVVAEVTALDKQLRSDRGFLHLDGPEFEGLRSLAGPPRNNWWWYPAPPSPMWGIAALFFLTFSVSILADFTRREFNSGPDGLGLFTIAVQALFALGATSTFTAAGRESIEALLSFLGIAGRHQPVIKLVTTLTLFATVSFVWKFLPGWLSNRYNDKAFQQQHSDFDAARTNFSRAISLNPSNVLAHFNLGSMYEDSYEYDKAADEYRRTIVLDPKHVRAYSNLSRLLLMQNDPLGALHVADDALKLPPDPAINAGLYRNRALAEFRLGFYNQAETDANAGIAAQASAAAPYCVLAKVYAHELRTADEHKAWQDFMARYGPDIVPRPEPDCVHLAQEALHEDH